jgi:hypothetical protein
MKWRSLTWKKSLKKSWFKPSLIFKSGISSRMRTRCRSFWFSKIRPCYLRVIMVINKLLTSLYFRWKILFTKWLMIAFNRLNTTRRWIMISLLILRILLRKRKSMKLLANILINLLLIKVLNLNNDETVYFFNTALSC